MRDGCGGFTDKPNGVHYGYYYRLTLLDTRVVTQRTRGLSFKSQYRVGGVAASIMS